jgi:hypothetical protein
MKNLHTLYGAKIPGSGCLYEIAYISQGYVQGYCLRFSDEVNS